MRHTLEQIGAVWLPTTVPPVATRLERAGWVPDEPGRVCPRCGLSVGPFEADADGCPACRDSRFPWQRLIRLGPYDGELREAVLDFKFSPWRRVGSDLGRLLGERVREQAGRIEPNAPIVVVPVPTTVRRRLGRGIDHALVLARGVASASGGRVRTMVGREHRRSQVSVAPSERGRNVARAFRARRGLGRRAERASRPVIVVVDDVLTTGATLRGVCRAVGARLRREGTPAVVWSAVACVSQPGRDRATGDGAANDPAGPPAIAADRAGLGKERAEN